MAAVQVTLPRMLADLVGSERRLEVAGATVGEALDALAERHPELSVHIFDKSGAVRRHVSIFHNERLASLDASAADGDSVVVLQAVSGG